MTSKIDNEKFGKRLEECMKKANITNTEITKALNLNKNAIGNYKNGQIPNATILFEISNFLRISMDYLLTGKESADLTKEEQKLIDLYRNTNEIGQPLTMKHAEDIQKALPRAAELPDQEELSASRIG